MKNKRMKLTALAMSVLMAMSTITSVTWAADLFTDGAPAEVAVEAPAEADLIVEDEIVAEDASLNGYSATDLREVEFYENNGGAVAARFKVADENAPGGSGLMTFNDAVVQMSSGTKKDATCYAAECAIYIATIKLGDGDITVYSTETRHGDANVINNASV